MGTAVGTILGAILVIYNTLPVFGVHVNPLPNEAGAAAVTLITLLVGLFTKPPAPKDPAKAAAAVAEAKANESKARAEYTKRTGLPLPPKADTNARRAR